MKHILGFVLVFFSIAFCQSDIKPGSAPEFWMNTLQKQSFYSSRGVEGEINRNLVDWNTLQYVIIAYQHFGNACDERSCNNLGYSSEIAHKNVGIPKYSVANGKVRFLFESKKFEFSNYARKKYKSNYNNTDYVVSFVSVLGDNKIILFSAPLK